MAGKAKCADKNPTDKAVKKGALIESPQIRRSKKNALFTKSIGKPHDNHFDCWLDTNSINLNIHTRK